MKNSFLAFLDLLKVKHTKSFSDQYFNEHPHKNNLFGLSKMLLDYGIENEATRIPDKENNITEIQTPFIAHFGGNFVVVNKVEQDKVFFIWKNDYHTLSIAKFVEVWTGIVLLTKTSEKSIEPDYKKHRKTELLNRLKKIFLFSAIGLLFTIIYICQSLFLNLGISILLLVNLAGMHISWLLMLKQMSVDSQYADKICSLFKQKDCNHVLESEAAKLWGVGWSEIGFGYFFANILMLLFLPALITYITLINIFTLPYAVWSVWYQKARIKQWCVLCLIVQVLLWTIFIINLLFGNLQLGEFFNLNNSQFSISNSQLAIVACCYCITILGINILVPKLSTTNATQSLQQSMNSVKANESVFEALLKQQPFYETNDCNSIIRFGNPNSKLQLTILSNPYCNPCSKMHKRIEELLQKSSNNISVQYILSSFNENLDSTNKFLIAACLIDKTDSAMQIFKDWFEKGKLLRDDYFKDMGLQMENPMIEVEFQKHELWKEKNRIRRTPTVLVNGYQLPEIYKIKDLRYFTN